MAYRAAPASAARASAAPALRLTMVAERVHHGALHGAWWPRGRDLAAELPALITGLDTWLGTTVPGEHVSRVLMRLSGWDAVPARVDIAGRRVRMAWSGAVDVHGIGITSSTGQHLDLLVIPPGAPVRLAGSAAGRAINPTNTLAPTAILVDTMPSVLGQAACARSRSAPGGAQSRMPAAALRLVDDGGPRDAEPPMPAGVAPAASPSPAERPPRPDDR